MSLEPATRVALTLFHGLSQVVVGQREVREGLVIALLAGGHVLLEGPPGTAKTLMVHALSRLIRSEFRRVQFTPDLMPSDIVGTQVLHFERGELTLRRGPVFTDLLLADEVNRAPARTQAALLEAMGERQVTLDGQRMPLSPLFTVVATQNPIEYEGTYPLPEAQLDRFMFKLLIDYPTATEEVGILARYRDGFDARTLEGVRLEETVSPDAVLEARGQLSRIEVSDAVMRYIVELVRRSRQWPGVVFGASPRAAVQLFQAAKVVAVLRGRSFVIPDDVKALALPVLRHRLVLRPEAVIHEQTPDDVIHGLLSAVEVPR
jgi:MoxR-like ATPase